MPKGTPSRALFFVGAAGCIINMIATVVVIFYDALFVLYPDWPWEGSPFPIFEIGLVGVILLSIGVFVVAAGYLGFKRNYGYSLGVVAFVFSMIVNTMATIESVIFTGLFFIVHVLSDLMIMLWGITHIISSKPTGKKGLSMSTGIMLVITGTTRLPLSRSYSLAPLVGWSPLFVYDIACRVLFLVSEILATILFFVAQVPPKKLE